VHDGKARRHHTIGMQGGIVMARLFGKDWTRAELLEHVGNVDQLGGAKRVMLVEGNTAGCEAVEFRTGTGLRFVVLPGRGLDISECDWCGEALAWRSQTGDVEASHFDPQGFNWLRSFYGGLLLTCGMSWAGAPCVDVSETGPEGYPAMQADGTWGQKGGLGLHGRVSHTPAKNVWVDGQWVGDEYEFWCQGKVTEAQVFKANLELTRKISAKLGSNTFRVEDRIENLGYEAQEHMHLYHCNFGFPLCQAGAQYLINSRETKPRDDAAAPGLDKWMEFPAPTPHFDEQCYYHDVATDCQGQATVALVNRNAAGGRGLGCAITYDKTTMPYFTEWKMPAQGCYVTGLEPANCRVEGRDKYRADGTLVMLEPGQAVEYWAEFEVLTSQEQIAAVEAKIKGLR
jgi:hypothetical protein